jgi:hypothetical protein
MDLISSLTRSLEALQECVEINAALLENLEGYVADAEESSYRIRRSLTSIFPFGEFRAGRVPIHDNNHTSQREAFARKFLKPLDQRQEWSENEREVLQSALDILYPVDELDVSTVDWDSVSRQCEQLSRPFDRSATSCHAEYVHGIDAQAIREWTPADDKTLTSLVDEFSGTNWEEIGRRLKRPPASCFTRCYSNLHPVLVPTDFTKEDDERLFEAVERLGDAGWGAIASELGTGHTDRQCMTRWNKTLRPGIQAGRWNPVLDARLLAAVVIYGEGNWVQVAQHVPGKTDRKCRERYEEKLKAGLKPTGEWSQSEDEFLERLIRKHGVGKWAKIASEMEGRTDQMCRQRFNKLANEVSTMDDLKKDYDEQLSAKRSARLARTRGSGPRGSQESRDESPERDVSFT